LGEAVKCFLDQDYSNKELIVLNDQEGVELFMENCPSNVKIINHPKRFNSLGEKRNYIKTLGNGDFFAIWDDDDLYRSWRISSSVKLIQENEGRYSIVKSKFAVMSVNNKDYKIVQNLFHSQACITRQYMLSHSYPNKSVGEDIGFESNARVGSFSVNPWYLYRWGNCGLSSGIHHLSGISDGEKSWRKSLVFEAYVEINGKVEIKPLFKRDYWSEIDEFLIKNRVNF
jgi:glycosyltransferase involved in cell wall biosynthesis